MCKARSQEAERAFRPASETQMRIRVSLEAAKKLVVGAPGFSRGELDFSPADKGSISEIGFKPRPFAIPALKRVIQAEFLPER